nr:zinc metallopeptidase [bacterium]
MPYLYYYTDWTWMILLPALVLSIWAQARVSGAYRKYSRVASSRGVTAEQAARMILDGGGAYDVNITQVAGTMTDHYNPASKQLALSQGVYGSTSVAALGIAAHEAGHALQDAQDYLPIRLHRVFARVAQFGSMASFPLILIGLLFTSPLLVKIGIIAYGAVVLYYLVTLPVEFNASRRAMAQLSDYGVVTQEEGRMVKSVLSAAAMTYVAAAASALLQLVRLLILTNRRRD